MGNLEDARAALKKRAANRRKDAQFGRNAPLRGHALEERERFRKEGKSEEEYRTYRRGQRAKAAATVRREHPERFDANGRPKPEWDTTRGIRLDPREGKPNGFPKSGRKVVKPRALTPPVGARPAPSTAQIADNLKRAGRSVTPLPDRRPIRPVPLPPRRVNNPGKVNAVRNFLNKKR